MTKLEVLSKVLKDYGIRHKRLKTHIVIRGQTYRKLPDAFPLRHLLCVAITYVKGKNGLIVLKSPKLWLRNTKPMPPTTIRRYGKRKWIEPFELVAYPVIFFDEKSETALKTRAYLKLWHETK